MRAQFVFPMFIACCLISGAPMAAIYKTVDEEGNVVFTDVPPKDQSKAIQIEKQNTYKPAPIAAPAASAEPSAAAEPEETAEDSIISYQSLRITSPTHDEAVRENAGNVTITVALDPALDTNHGHAVQILLDGNALTSAASTSMSLTNIDRGTHSLVAQVLDQAGQVIISSRPVTFHMLRTVQPQARTQPIN